MRQWHADTTDNSIRRNQTTKQAHTPLQSWASIILPKLLRNRAPAGSEASRDSYLKLGVRLRKKTWAQRWEGASFPPLTRGSRQQARESTRRAHGPSSSVVERALLPRRARPRSCAYPGTNQESGAQPSTGGCVCSLREWAVSWESCDWASACLGRSEDRELGLGREGWGERRAAAMARRPSVPASYVQSGGWRSSKFYSIQTVEQKISLVPCTWAFWHVGH